MKLFRIVLCAAALTLSGCGGETESNDRPEAPAAVNAADQASAEPSMPACPFRSTSGWAGSVEDGRLLVTGRVDLMMAGFRPRLSPRPGSAPGTLALDLALVPEANAAVSDQLRYERSGSPNYRRGEIWCGGERIAGFDVIVVG